MTGARPCRTRSPQLTESVTAPAIASSLANFAVTVVLLQPQNLGGDEYQEFATLVRELVALEQPSKQRQAIEAGGPTLRRLLAADVDATDHRRLAAADEHLRQGTLRVDRRDAVDRA